MRKSGRALQALFVPCLLFAAGSALADYDAAGVYQIRCGSCHGSAGEGTTRPPLGPPLKGNPLVMNAPASVIETVIRKGRQGTGRAYDGPYPNMPAFSAVSVPDVDALIEYLKGDLQQ